MVACALWLLWVAGCECGAVPEDLRVSGEHGYVRCLAGDPPESRSWQVGELRLALSGRSLKVTGPDVLRVVAYAGPGHLSEIPDTAFSQVVEARPHLALMIGSVGDTAAAAARHLRLAAAAPFPTLVLAGGRDRFEDLREAMDSLEKEERDRVIDISSLRSVELGQHVWVLAPGAVAGRYARDEGACGISHADLQAMPEAVKHLTDRAFRWLVAWQAPSGGGAQGVTRVGHGLDVGEPALEELARAVGAQGGLFAWPEVRVMLPAAEAGDALVRPGEAYADMRLVVPPLAGSGVRREDGSRSEPGFALLRFDDKGMMRLESD